MIICSFVHDLVHITHPLLLIREQMEIQDCLVKLVNRDKQDCLENLYVHGSYIAIYTCTQLCVCTFLCAHDVCKSVHVLFTTYTYRA